MHNELTFHAAIQLITNYVNKNFLNLTNYLGNIFNGILIFIRYFVTKEFRKEFYVN